MGDYEVGETIDHVDGVTLTDPEHMLATRLWQNTAKVHFNVEARPDGNRLVYGGHVISMARALSFNGLANAQLIRRSTPARTWPRLSRATRSTPGLEVLDRRDRGTGCRSAEAAARGDEGSGRDDDTA